MRLKVTEIFYSLQGEGAEAGTASIFVRLSGCSVKNACSQSGVRCDTEYESGELYSLADLLKICREERFFGCDRIIWTGGEPLDQLTNEVTNTFKAAGFYQCLETSGARKLPGEFDYITVSPKVAEHILLKNLPPCVDELRYIIQAGDPLPRPELSARHYFLSPHFDGPNPNRKNIDHCIRLCLENPKFRLSVQGHKLWKIP